MKKFLLLAIFLLIVILPARVFAQTNSFVSVVNPIRGNDFWDLKDQKPETAVLGQASILDKLNLPATWLIRFDALGNTGITRLIANRKIDEKGLFLEVTPAWAAEAKVQYRQSDSWHAAGSAFLTGYDRQERERLIDAAFEKFNNTFGSYPVSVGAWWIDSYSLGYMQKKYNISAALIVADQYSTDNYQIWGQYFGTPYYPAVNNALHPASSAENRLPVVMVQWAARDPVNSYGNGVDESTFSVQANDYIDYHDLDVKYFSSLVDIYTKQQLNKFGQVVVGLENSYSWSKYSSEYQKQIQALADKKIAGQIQIATLADFSSWYKNSFPKISPEQLIIADDPLGSFKKAVWYMNPYYRAALFVNQEGVVFRDIRQYIEGEEELCFLKNCQSVNFATFATRVLDDVTYGHKWVIDEGRVKDFNVSKGSEGYLISYVNEAGNKREIVLMPRDIKVDGRISSIDGTILNAISQGQVTGQKSNEFKNGSFIWSAPSTLFKIFISLLFAIFALLIPGLVVTNKLYGNETPAFQRIFVSIVVGLVVLTIIFYITSFIHFRSVVFVYLLISLLLFLRLKIWTALKFNLKKADKWALISILVIISGTIFQVIPTFRSGLTFPYGLGFWGPNTHDGIWHVSLINQAIKGLPVENPIFAGTPLKNYHFFYDLLVAVTATLTKIPVSDLVFRIYPIIFSLLLGIGTYYLVLNLFANKVEALKLKIAAILSLYFVYFSGSFGWIVEYLKQKTLGGESAFWANQSISFNLNPPFAISLIAIIAFLLIFINKTNRKPNSFWKIATSALLIGSLAGFKIYGAMLVIVSLFPIAVLDGFKKRLSVVYILILSSLFAAVIFFSNFQTGQQLVVFSPFWFIHSMIDSPSRVGWERLSLARVAGWETGNWFKYISAEIIGLLLFIGGNMGMRILSFAVFLKPKEVLSDKKYLFLLLFSVVSFAVPLIFIQEGNPWNMIQFSYYGLYIAAVAAGVVLSRLIFKTPKILSIIVLLIVLLLTPINSVTTASYYVGLPHAIVSRQESEALKFLSNQPDGIVLTYPYDDKIKNKFTEPRPLFAYDSTAYVAALSKKSVFIEDEPQNQILLTDYKKRIVATKDFFLKPIAESSKFLEDNNIKYIYLPKTYNIQLDESGGIVKNIFVNEAAVIYRIEQ